jgi:hypothetical protein
MKILFFFISPGGMAIFFKFQNLFFFQNCPFPSGGMASFFKIQKQKISIQILNEKFQIFLVA